MSGKGDDDAAAKAKATIGDEGYVYMYRPSDSRMDDDNMVDFIRAPFDSAGDLQQVPGVGPVTAERMRAVGVTNAYQLLGKFFMLRGDNDLSRQHCERFWAWLDALGTPKGYRSTVVRAIAEKAAAMMPGIYDPSCFAE